MDARTPRSAQGFSVVRDLPAQFWRVSPRWRLIGGIIAAALAIWLVRSLMAPHASAPMRPPPPVRVATAWMQNVTVKDRTIGTIVANSTVQVISRVEGQLVNAAFKEGDIVHKGDLLFQIDPRPFQAAVAQTVATQQKDQAQLVSARHDAQRYAALVRQGAVSQSQADQFEAQAKALEATVSADKANVDAAKLNLIYTQIRSPIDGKTGPILVQPGNMVPANGTNPLVVIMQIQPVKVSFFLPQAELPRIQDQMRKHQLIANLAAHDSNGVRLTAPVDFVGNAVDNTTGTVELRATFDNRDFSLVPGQLLDVAVSLETLSDAVVAPHDAVNTGPQGRYVYVVNQKGDAEMQPVTVLYDDGKTAAVKGRVRAGDRLITDGQLLVIPGKPVTVVKGASPRQPATSGYSNTGP